MAQKTNPKLKISSIRVNISAGFNEAKALKNQQHALKSSAVNSNRHYPLEAKSQSTNHRNDKDRIVSRKVYLTVQCAPIRRKKKLLTRVLQTPRFAAKTQLRCKHRNVGLSIWRTMKIRLIWVVHYLRYRCVTLQCHHHNPHNRDHPTTTTSCTSTRQKL